MPGESVVSTREFVPLPLSAFCRTKLLTSLFTTSTSNRLVSKVEELRLVIAADSVATYTCTRSKNLLLNIKSVDPRLPAISGLGLINTFTQYLEVNVSNDKGGLFVFDMIDAPQRSVINIPSLSAIEHDIGISDEDAAGTLRVLARSGDECNC